MRGTINMSKHLDRGVIAGALAGGLGGGRERGLNIVVLLNTQVVKLPSKYLCLHP